MADHSHSESTMRRPEGALAFPVSRSGDGDRALIDRLASARSLNIQRRPPPGSRGSGSGGNRRGRGGGGLRRGSSPLNSTSDHHDGSGRSGGSGGNRRGRGGSAAADFESLPSLDARQRGRGRSPTGSNSTSSSYAHSPNVVLSPRADAWAYLSASSFAGAASLARAHGRYHSDAAAFVSLGASAATVVAMLSINAALALGIGVAYRFKPSLVALTRLRMESVLAAATLLFWAIALTLYNAPVDAGMLTDMRHPESDGWDANSFYSLWASGLCSMYLVADLLSGNCPTGRTVVAAGSSRTDVTARSWILLLFSSILLLAFSIAIKTGPMCEGRYLRDGPCCTSTDVSLVTSVLGMLLCLGQMLVNRIVDVVSRQRRGVVKTTTEHLLAMPVLIGYVCNVGFVTGPGGAGANVSNMYVASWLSLLLSLKLNVEYLGLHLTMDINSGDRSIPDRARRRTRSSERSSFVYATGNNNGSKNSSPYVTSEEENSDDEAVVLPPRLMYAEAASNGRRSPGPGVSLSTERSAWGRNSVTEGSASQYSRNF